MGLFFIFGGVGTAAGIGVEFYKREKEFKRVKNDKSLQDVDTRVYQKSDKLIELENKRDKVANAYDKLYKRLIRKEKNETKKQSNNVSDKNKQQPKKNVDVEIIKE